MAMDDHEFRCELVRLQIANAKTQSETRHTNRVLFERCRMVHIQLRMWIQELDRVLTR
jgi:hypothetical protein